MSAAYDLFLRAMRERKQVVCMYQGKRREVCPIILGRSGDREKLLAYQFGGASSRPLTDPKSRWRCMFLDEVSNIVLREGPWRAGDNHSTSQTCVADVDYDVNPDSPYHPQFQL
jgi:hypothetical protein